MRARGRSCTESCKKRRCFKAATENRNITVDWWNGLHMHYKDSTGRELCGNGITENYLAVNEDHVELQGCSSHWSPYFLSDYRWKTKCSSLLSLGHAFLRPTNQFNLFMFSFRKSSPFSSFVFAGVDRLNTSGKLCQRWGFAHSNEYRSVTSDKKGFFVLYIHPVWNCTYILSIEHILRMISVSPKTNFLFSSPLEKSK